MQPSGCVSCIILFLFTYESVVTIFYSLVCTAVLSKDFYFSLGEREPKSRMWEVVALGPTHEVLVLNTQDRTGRRKRTQCGLGIPCQSAEWLQNKKENKGRNTVKTSKTKISDSKKHLSIDPFLRFAFVLWSVTVCSGCHTKYHRPSGLKNRHSFLTVLEAKNPRSSCQPFGSLVRALFLSCRWLGAFFSMTSHGRKRVFVSLPPLLWILTC